MIWILVLPFAAWAALRVAGLEPAWPWVPLVAFTPYVALASIVPAALSAVRRRWPAAAVAALSCATLAAGVLPRYLPDANPAAAGPPLRVLAANLQIGQGEPEALLALVRSLRPDVLTLQELTPATAARIEALGLRDLLPHAVVRAAPGAAGSAVYARHPVRELPLPGHFRQARAVMTVAGREVDVVSVHPCAPRYDGPSPCWREGLDTLPRAEGRLRVLAGDFNATLDHPPLRDLLASGYRDAADVAGQGLTNTWPMRGWGLLPGVAIDHVLAGAPIAVTAFSAHTLAGTDHRPVFAALRLPR
ncbi:endonuclease/exonuclease/phosphatase family protein [Nonomuraea typhae]|uniref:endonuclease/exonuclease/phosphatase family protein n=1 Tax=Nonomuraea typhae TaxID=2603600 RepID=UPI001C67BFA8|nr:endonuclease/exonuclease/phosphatase family protein [Nonomuraea typhae]